MKLWINVVCLMILGSLSPWASAHEEELSPGGSLLITVSRGGDSTDVSSVLFIEVPSQAGISGWATFQHGRSYRSAYLGISKTFGNWTVALGGGPSWYDDWRGVSMAGHWVMNPWVIYDDEVRGITAYLTIERTAGDPKPWYLKGYTYKNITGPINTGFYGETGFGVGPAVGFSDGERFHVWFAVPVTAKPSDPESRMRWAAGIAYLF